MTASPTLAIVLVDDEPAVLAILHCLLRDLTAGYDLISVTDGAAALAQFAHRSIALVITDDHMPGMDGLALITAVKVVAPTCPVVLITAANAHIERGAWAAGADFYLPMPFPFTQFAAAVQTALTHEAAVGGAARDGTRRMVGSEVQAVVAR